MHNQHDSMLRLPARLAITLFCLLRGLVVRRVVSMACSFTTCATLRQRVMRLITGHKTVVMGMRYINLKADDVCG